MPFSLTLSTREPSGIAHLTARGEATSSDFPSQQAHFDTALGASWPTQRVSVNMDEVAYLDSAAIGWLIGVQKQFRAAGGKLVLHSLQPPVKNILNLLKIERVVPLAPTADAAREMLLAAAAECAA